MASAPGQPAHSRRDLKARQLETSRRTVSCVGTIGERRAVQPDYRKTGEAGVSPKEWRDPDSNRGHHDFQSCALPTELSRPGAGDASDTKPIAAGNWCPTTQLRRRA